jgi:xylose isomerase
MRKYAKGAFTNPDPQVRADLLAFLNEAADVVRALGAQYLKVWPGQDGWDYPFQVDHHQQWDLAVSGMCELAQANPDVRMVIEYKPREPRQKMFWDSAAKTILGIQAMGVDNVGVLLDFGHALFGGESPAASAQLLIDHGLLWAMDVNDNLRGWDDDMVVGTVHPVEVFEFFYTLKVNGWEGVWQLDQFPFREDTVEAAKLSIRFLKAIHRALDELDIEDLRAAQHRQDAMGAQKLVQDVLFASMREEDA